LASNGQVVEIEVSQTDTANQDSDDPTHMGDLSNDVAEDAEHVHESDFSNRVLGKEPRHLEHLRAKQC